MEIAHHAQLTDYTCGPAAMKMALDGLVGLRLPEADLASAMGTRADIGTRQRMMYRFADELGLIAYVKHTNSQIEDIREAMATGHVVIVCYWLAPEDTDHYAVVAGLRGDRIILNDPWAGPATEMPLDEFDAHWLGDDAVEGRRDRWMLALKEA